MNVSQDDTITLTPAPDQAPCAVLLVEDDEMVRRQLAALLTTAGYSVKVASTGEEALEMFDAERFRIVLTDWEMPDMDGLALCRNIRARHECGYVYLLLLTVRRARRDVLAGLAAGADDYIAKGASSEEVLARMNVGRRITGLQHSLKNASRVKRRAALTDELTGAHSRRYLMTHLPREFDRSRRHKHALALLACDLDHFRQINNGFGYDAGDQVLEAFHEIVASVVRTSDWVARTGGEEFMIVLPETDLEGGRVAAERIRERFAAMRIATSAGPLSTTVSIGYAAIANPTDLRRWTSDDLLRTAEDMLGRARKAGGNRSLGSAVMAPSSAVPPAPPGAVPGGQTQQHEAQAVVADRATTGPPVRQH